MELATDGDVALAADGDDADTDILVVEYISDDETLTAADKVKPDDDNDDDCDHVLKVRQYFRSSFLLTSEFA